jgi:hypothetical protein
VVSSACPDLSEAVEKRAVEKRSKFCKEIFSAELAW